MKKNKYNITRELLEREYIVNDKTQPELARMFGCSEMNINYHLQKYGIKKLDVRDTEFIGKKFGSLTVLEKLQKKDNWGARLWLCQCNCGQKTEKSTGALTQSRKNKSKFCKYCKPGINSYERKSKKWGEILCRYWNSIKRNAIVRNLSFEIDIGYGWNLFLQQNRKCALTDINIYFAKTPKERKSKLWTASLDRIDSTKGYVKGNVQWVHKDINKMKREYSQEYFIDLCTKIADFTSGQEN